MSKPKFFNVYGKAVDSNGKNHYVTIVGKLEQTRENTLVQETVSIEAKPRRFVDGVIMYPYKHLVRRLTLGLSICHPKDEFNKDEGIRIAKGRIERGETLGSLETTNVTMLTNDAIEAELIVKLNHVCQNIDDYISD